MTTDLSMDVIVERFVAWAGTQDDIRAAAIVGSRAREELPADEWSDLDLVAVVDDPRRYLESAAWVAQIAEPRLTFLEPTAVGGLTERRVLFDGARDVDFTFAPTAIIRQWRAQGQPDEIAAVLGRGARLLFDKDGGFAALLAGVRARPGRPPAPPSADVFVETVNDFLYHAIWCAKKLRRGELWVAKMSCDAYLKRLLLRLIEWHAQAQQNWDLDTWHAGRFLDRWADPQALHALPDTFAAYAPPDVQRALLATVELFRRLGVAVALHLDYSYPVDAHDYVVDWIRKNSSA